MEDSMVWEKRKQAQKKILDALQMIEPLSIKMPSEQIGKNEYHLKLHPRQIDVGTHALILTLLMSAGSTESTAGNVDLYELLKKYLILPEFRYAVNNLMKEHPLLSEHIHASME